MSIAPRLVIGLVLLAVAGTLAWRAWNVTPDDLAAEAGWDRSAVAVELAEVEVDTARDVRVLTGTLRVVSGFDVSPRIGGRIARLPLDIGDRVTRGQVLVELDGDEFALEVEQARAELRVAEALVTEASANHDAARRDLQRVERLRQQRIVAEAEEDAARSLMAVQGSRLRVAEAVVIQRAAALSAAEVRLSYTKVRAEWQGGGEHRVVGRRFVDEGQTVAANTPLLSVLELDSLLAVVFTAERDYPRLHPGQLALVSADALPGVVHEGRIERIAPLFEESSRQARVEVGVDNPSGDLKPGMFARVQVELGRVEQAVMVPIQALVRRDGRDGVFLADTAAGVARFVAVRIGIRERERVQIAEPVLEGRVVVLGQHLLNDGLAIVVPTADAPATIRLQ